MTDVYLEVGTKRVFACAVDWPGWCRSGKDEAHALEILAVYAPRYAVVARQAGLRWPRTAATTLDVVERLPGSATTDFGVPGAIRAADAESLTAAQARRLAALLDAAWAIFDRVVDGAPAALRKGPRGGGRDRDKIADHVLGAEVGYGRQVGVRFDQPARDDRRAIDTGRSALTAAVRSNDPPDRRWPPRYAARRIAWHVLDHAWEIEDRSSA